MPEVRGGTRCAGLSGERTGPRTSRGAPLPRFKVDSNSRERGEEANPRSLMAAAVTVLYGGELAKDVAARLVEGARTYL